MAYSRDVLVKRESTSKLALEKWGFWSTIRLALKLALRIVKIYRKSCSKPKKSVKMASSCPRLFYMPYISHRLLTGFNNFLLFPIMLLDIFFLRNLTIRLSFWTSKFNKLSSFKFTLINLLRSRKIFFIFFI